MGYYFWARAFRFVFLLSFDFALPSFGKHLVFQRQSKTIVEHYQKKNKIKKHTMLKLSALSILLFVSRGQKGQGKPKRA
jgi:hypothetical protein